MSRLRLRPWLVLAVITAVGCGSTVPPPSPSPATPVVASPSGEPGTPTHSPAPTPPPKVVGDLALEMCDPQGLLPCDHQAAVLSEQIAGAGVSLTYSTEWADGRLDRPVWNAGALGLGGWSLDVLVRYDQENHVLLAGTGSWRIAEATAIGNEENAVPAFDGYRYFVFDADWRHVRTVDAITGIAVLSFTYDAQGRLATVAGQRDGGIVQLTIHRTADGALDALAGLDDTRTRTAVDARGRLVSIGRPTGTALDVSLDAFGLVRRWQASGGRGATYEYDEIGRVAKATDADEVTLDYTREEAAGSVGLRIVQASGVESSLLAERAGGAIRRTYTDPAALVTTLDTNPLGTTLTRPDGTVTTTTFAPHPRWGSSAPLASSVVETGSDGRPTRLNLTSTMGTGAPEPAGSAWEARWTLDGTVYTDTYDPATRTLQRTDPEGRITTVVFDPLGRIVERRVPGEPMERFTYDSAGRLAAHALGSDQGAATTTYAYDPATGEVTATPPDGSTVRANFDAYGNLMSTSAEGGEFVYLMRNASGDAVQVRSGDHPATSVGYSPAGRPSAVIPVGVGDDLTYQTMSYTAQGELQRVVGPGPKTIELERDPAGRVVAVHSAAGTTTAEYDPAGRLSRLSTADHVTTSLAYDGALIGLAWSGPVSGSVSRSVDGQGVVATELVNGADGFSYGRDQAGLLTSIDRLVIERDAPSGLPVSAALGSVSTTREYDGDGRMRTVTTTIGGETVARIEYVYDSRGRINAITQTDTAGASTSIAYAYDASDRLASMTVDGTVVETYEYDAAGNRLEVTLPGSTISATYDDRDRITAWAGETFTHSPDGTLLSRTSADATTGYEFDDLGALRSVTLPDGRLVEYIVDGQGRRIGRAVDGEITDGFLYSPTGEIVAWTDGAGQVLAHFAYDDFGRLALVRRDGRDLLAVTDQRGSPLLLIDGTSGEIAQQVAYDTWGAITAEDGSPLTPFGFAGGLLDPATGLVHFSVRDYDPSTGRWTSPDPRGYAGGDANLYRYAGGDPVNLKDPAGLAACPVERCAANPGARATRAGRAHSPFPKPIVGGGSSGGGSSGPTDDLGDPFQWPTIGPPGKWSCVGVCKPWGPILGPNRGVCLGPCAGSTPSGNNFACLFGCVWGEPHIVTADGVDLDFQAAGEFVFARSADGLTVVQARLEPPASSNAVTRGTALAALVSGDRVVFYADPTRPVVVNGVTVARADYEERLAGGGVISRHGTHARITWPDGLVLGVNVYPRFVNFGFVVPESYAATFAGILGNWDGEASNDVVTRDGRVISPSDPAFFDLLHHEFADSWRIQQSESLFDYLPGETTETFTRRDVPSEPASIDMLDESTRAEADSLCRSMGVSAPQILADCILDFGLTGDPAYVGSALTVAADAAYHQAARPVTATPIGVGQVVSGELAAGAVASYVLDVAGGEIVYLDAQGECATGLTWRLIQPDGVAGPANDACSDIGRVVLDMAGGWTIELRTADLGGSFSFAVLAVPPTLVSPISLGAGVSGEITDVGEWQRYVLSANANEFVYLDAEGDCVAGLWWRFLRPDGSLFAFGDSCTDLGRRQLDADGDWSIDVYSDTTATGTYAFRVLEVPAPQAKSVSVGASGSGSIAAIGEVHSYSLAATAGEIVYFDAQGDCVDDLWWRLLRPDGGLAAFNTACTDLGRRVLDATGEWRVEIYSDFTATGPYAFRLIAVAPPLTDVITLGELVSGTIGAIGEWHRYRLSLAAGQVLSFDAAGECIDDLWWRVLRPDEGLASFNTSCSDLGPVTVDVSGEWSVEVYSDFLATGPYSFTVIAAE